MKKFILSNSMDAKMAEEKELVDHFHSVEFYIGGRGPAYQFKIWKNVSTMPMCFLVKENSDVLPMLKVGDVLGMKYYSDGSAYPTDYLETEILNITKDDQGPFKGHYLVALELLEN